MFNFKYTRIRFTTIQTDEHTKFIFYLLYTFTLPTLKHPSWIRSGYCRMSHIVPSARASEKIFSDLIYVGLTKNNYKDVNISSLFNFKCRKSQDWNIIAELMCLTVYYYAYHDQSTAKRQLFDQLLEVWLQVGHYVLSK